MIKNLHFCLLLLISVFFCEYSFSQNERIKLVKTEQGPVKNTDVSGNIPEVINTLKGKPENSNSVTKLRSHDSLQLSQNKKVQQNGVAVQTSAKMVNTDNVTYTKEDFQEDVKNVSSETRTVKVKPSVNYTPKVIREDIHPAAGVTSGKISLNKRIYLQQEADDLQREISQNAGNSNYDLASRQKQLDDIRKLLKD